MLCQYNHKPGDKISICAASNRTKNIYQDIIYGVLAMTEATEKDDALYKMYSYFTL